jgi:hypothetical protein
VQLTSLNGQVDPFEDLLALYTHVEVFDDEQCLRHLSKAISEHFTV